MANIQINKRKKEKLKEILLKGINPKNEVLFIAYSSEENPQSGFSLAIGPQDVRINLLSAILNDETSRFTKALKKAGVPERVITAFIDGAKKVSIKDAR